MKPSLPFRIINTCLILAFGIALLFEPDRFSFMAGLYLVIPCSVYLIMLFIKSPLSCRWFKLHYYEPTTFYDWRRTKYNFRCRHCQKGLITGRK